MDVRGLVVSCMLNIVLSLAHNIKSGWKSIFEIFKIAAKDRNSDIIRESFTAVNKIVEGHLSHIHDHFYELIDCLVSFSKNYIEEISIGAINALQVCAHEYASGNMHTEVWFALLSGLANLVLDVRESIQSKALDTLFNILQFSDFTNEQWKTIYSGVIVPLFDDIQYCT
jgi:Sec7-like guanine-nucleotide exchange factor